MRIFAVCLWSDQLCYLLDRCGLFGGKFELLGDKKTLTEEPFRGFRGFGLIRLPIERDSTSGRLSTEL